MILAATAALLLTAAPAPAGDANALAVELSRLVLSPESYRQISTQTGRQVGQMVASSAQEQGQDLGPGFMDEVRAGTEQMMAEMMPPYQEMVDMQAGLLVKHYTAAELKELLAFYRTTLGKKVIRIMPEVSADVMGWMQTVLKQRLPQAGERFKARLEAWKARQDGVEAEDDEEEAPAK